VVPPEIVSFGNADCQCLNGFLHTRYLEGCRVSDKTKIKFVLHRYCQQEDDQKLLEDKLGETVKGSGGIPVRKHLKHGSVPVCINELADKSPDELIVMATHGCDSLSDYLTSSNTEQVIRHSHHPVLVCPSPAKPQQVESVPA